MLGSPLRPEGVAAVAGRIAANGANIDRITRLASDPVTCVELDVSGAEPVSLRNALAAVAVESGVDVAVQRAGLHRRAMRLIVMDVDSTLIQDEVIDLLAERAGCADEVAKVTESAMRGELDFAASLRERVALLAGLDAAVLDEVRASPAAHPGRADAGADAEAPRLQVRDRQRRVHRGDRAARRRARHRLRGGEHP